MRRVVATGDGSTRHSTLDLDQRQAMPMRRRPYWWLLAILTICFAVHATAEWRGAASISFFAAAVILLIAFGALLVGAVASCAVTLGLAAALFSRSLGTTTRRAAMIAGKAAVLFAVATASIVFAEEARMLAFGRAAERAEPLLSAIRRYEAELGVPPADLADLVPDWIESAPPTSLVSYPTFKFYPSADREGLDDTWGLIIYCGRGFLNWDVFVFYADGNYEGVGTRWGGTSERVGEWAYVHE